MAAKRDSTFEASMRALGIDHLHEALLCLPTRFVDRRHVFRTLRDAPIGSPVLILAWMTSFRGLDRAGNPSGSLYPASVEWVILIDGRDEITARFFGMPVEQAEAIKGSSVVVEAEIHHGSAGAYLKKARLQAHTGRVDAVYSGISGKISGDKVAVLIRQALDTPGSLPLACGLIRESVTVRRALDTTRRSPASLLRALHSPDDVDQGLRALQFARKATVAEIQDLARLGTQGSSLHAQYCIDSELIECVGQQTEQLSGAQRRALNTVRRAFNHFQSARVLLNGDVGSGKTLVFLLAVAAVARTTRRPVAVLVPSELVARQIHESAFQRFPDLSPTLHSSDSAPGTGNSLMHIGTQALLHRKPAEAYAAIVIDEQQKFSVEQRMALAGPTTHVIEASATPIPRSLALALFKGWVQARIDSTPVQKSIESHVMRDPDQRQEVVHLVQKHLRDGKKVVFLYPRVQGTSHSVVERSKLLSERFPGMVVSIHGKVKAADKEAALDRFRTGECPIAVASTAVEVGVDVPNIGLMVVSSADRFGATQLHQLRGRLVRNGGTGDFVMYVGKSCSRDAMKRLNAVRRLSSGFDLAEADLEMRGFGDVIGDLQSGKSRSTFLLTKLTAADFLSCPDNMA